MTQLQDLRSELVSLLPRLRRFAYSLCNSLDEGDDLVQAACERALGRLHQFEPGTRLDSWMFRIIQTIWIDRRRSASFRKTDNDMDALGLHAQDARIPEQIEARNALAIVQGEMEKLSEEQRVIVSLVTIDGLSYHEAAETLGIPIGTVMSRLARARSRLAAALDRPPHGGDDRARPTL